MSNAALAPSAGAAADLRSRLTSLTTRPPAALNWSTETVTTGVFQGEVLVSVTSTNSPRLIFYEAGTGFIREATKPGNVWNVQPLGNRLVLPQYAEPILAIDTVGAIHFAYSDGSVHYGRLVNGEWVLQTVDRGYPRALRIDGAGTPHLNYIDSSCVNCQDAAIVKHARLDAAGWSTQQLVVIDYKDNDSTLTLDGAGQPHLVASGVPDSGVTYFRWNGSTFSREPADREYFASSISLAIDSSGFPRLAYSGGRRTNLRYVELTPNGWRAEIVDQTAVGGTGSSASLALDHSGAPHLSYGRSGADSVPQVQYSRRIGGQWLTETVDRLAGAGSTDTTLRLGDDGTPHIAYRTGNVLKYATGRVAAPPPAITATPTGTTQPTPVPTSTPQPTPAPSPGPNGPAPTAATTMYVPVANNAAPDPAFGGVWRTGLQVFNLDASGPANVQIRYVNRDGSVAAVTPTVTVAAGRSQTFFGATSGVPEGFTGSAVVTADRAVTVVVNQLAQEAGMAGSFDAVSSPGPRVSAPVVLRDANDVNTVLHVQNAGAATLSQVTVRIYRVDEVAPGATRVIAAPLAPGAAFALPLAGITELGAGFLGSAVIEATQPLAVVANHSNGQFLQASAGQIAGAARLFGPLVMSNNAGFGSAVQIQNVGTTTTAVTMRVVSSLTGVVYPAQTRTLVPGAATNLRTALLVGSDERFVGSVVVEASGGGQIVGVVHQANGATNQASAYTLFTSGAATITAPLVQTSNSGWSSGFQIQNVGAQAATVTVVVVDAAGHLVGTVTNPTRTLAPGASETWFPITELGTPLVGSATAISPPGSQLVGVVNQLNAEAGPVDFFTTYEALGR
ncbi:MAG: hypothetical protein HY329_18730 [Chloroflexi bacterium]|nr:hypothetical protein [Chloroflexota bacterium]